MNKAQAQALLDGMTPGPWEAAERGGYSDFDGDSRVILGNDIMFLNQGCQRAAEAAKAAKAAVQREPQ